MHVKLISFRRSYVRPMLSIAAAMASCISGCQVLSPRPIPNQAQHIAPELVDGESAQIEIGRAHPVIDTVGWVVGIPGKITLWDRRVDNHNVSEPTVRAMAAYLDDNHLPHVKVRANQYAPLADFRRLKKNTTVAWPYRYTFGLLSVAQETILPGRVFGGDHFNPYTQTIHLYSDVPSIAMHEGAHAKDFSRRKYQGTYAAAYMFVPLWHETLATEDVFAYVQTKGTPRDVDEANRILYPAYGTYVGSALGGLIPAQSTPLYYGSVIAGHINGRMLSKQRGSNPSSFSQHFAQAAEQSDSAGGQSDETVQQVGFAAETH
tara:strand:+ start:98496 stop:99452 length:957 start_codon:yes stop_codon:yes gene_type:complete